MVKKSIVHRHIRVLATLKKPFKPMPKSFHLEIETAVYVPSTRFDKRVSQNIFNARVEETRRKLSQLLGGYTSVQAVGGYVSQGKKLIKEPVVKVTAFATKKAYVENRHAYLVWLNQKKKDWKQESIGYEYEGDLFYF